MLMRSKDIFKILKTAFFIAAAVLFLSACGVNSDKNSVAIISDEKDVDGMVLQEQQRSCWQAELLGLFYNAMGEASIKAYPKVTSSAMPFMMVAFAVWLSIRLLKHVSSVVEESPAEVWSEVVRMAFTCLICGLLASSTTFLLWTLNTIILPIYYTFLEYGSLVLNNLSEGGDVNSQGIYMGQANDGVCLIYTNNIVCKAPPLEKVTNNVFPSGPNELMQCLTCATSDRLQVGFAIGKELMGVGNLSSVLGGFLMFAVFFIVKFSFVFYMIDSIFRMNIMVILLPCLIMAYPFKFSRKWAKAGFLGVLNSAAIIAFIAILASMAILAMQMILIDNSETLGTKNLYREFGPEVLSLILIAFLILKSIGLAVSLAGTLVGGGAGTSFQKRIGKMAAWIGKRAFSIVTGGVGKIVLSTTVGQKLKAARDNAQKAISKAAGRR
ncbi:MAG: hypothetical protein J5895_02460 [Alphaproteobacteria bacterium]|nr:hypothetical protein [Alphaproteobacteria bacterium]